MGACNVDELEKSTVANIVLRAAAAALSVVAAIMAATARQSVGDGNGVPVYTVSFSDYKPLVYAVVANGVAAILQAIVIYLKVSRKEEDMDMARPLVELLDVAALGLTASSAGASFAVTDMLAPARMAISFYRQIRVVSILSAAAAAAASLAVLTKNVKVNLSVTGPEPSFGVICSPACRH